MATDHELRLRERLARLRSLNLLGGARVSGELEKLQRQLERIQAAPTDEEIWRSVELARHQDRPYTLDYVNRLFDDWVELHGDRGRADGRARREPEGPRHQGTNRAQLRHGVPGGLSQGDASDGARRAAPLSVVQPG